MPLSPLQKALEAAANGGSVRLNAADAAKLARLLVLILQKRPTLTDRPTMDTAAPEQDPYRFEDLIWPGTGYSSSAAR